MQRKVSEQQTQTANLAHRLERNSPTRRIVQDRQKLIDIDTRLARALSNTLANKQTAFARVIEKLNLISPLNTLSRGYAIATKDKQVIRSIDDVEKGDAIKIRVQNGEVSCTVKTTKAIS
jgi:exodeoxyribonuclease VII large subunit